MVTLDNKGEPIPPPLLIPLPRIGYLYMELEVVLQHFGLAEERSEDYWFSCEGEAVRWNLPIGALYDSFIGACQGASDAQQLWKLSLHCDHFPGDSIIQCSKESAKLQFMDRLKVRTFYL